MRRTWLQGFRRERVSEEVRTVSGGLVAGSITGAVTGAVTESAGRGGRAGIRDGAGTVDSVLSYAAAALEGSGDLRNSLYWFEAAYAEGERTADAFVMAKAALGLSGLWVHDHRPQLAASLLGARLQHALSVVDPQSTLGLRLRIRAASEADHRTGESTRILAVLDEARAAGDPVALAEALSRAHDCLLGPEHGELRRTLADELVGAA